jgi:hypothetical protein
VPQDVHALLDPRHALGAANRFDHAIARDGRSIRQAQHLLASEMPSRLEGRRQSLRQWELS